MFSGIFRIFFYLVNIIISNDWDFKLNKRVILSKIDEKFIEDKL